MQQRPHSGVLLDAVKQFLEELTASASDDSQRRRLRLAGELLEHVAIDLAASDRLIKSELKGLVAILGDDDAGNRPLANRGAKQRRLAELNRELSYRIRSGELDDAALPRVHRHLLTNLGAALAVGSPNFDRSMDLEGDS